jgi:MFS family permease
VAGVASDRVGRTVTLVSVFLLQASNMVFFSGLSTFTGFVVGSAVVGFSYGARLSLFPATAADRWGTRNLGLNYGILFTAWGVGGVFGPLLAGWIADTQGSYAPAYNVAAWLLVGATFLSLLSYVAIDFNLPEREVTIRLAPKRPAPAPPMATPPAA